MNNTMFRTLIRKYDHLSYTHNYMFGFADHGTIWCALATSDLLPFVCTLDHASRGQGCALRFKPTLGQKELLKTCETFAVCSEAYFNDLFASTKYNRGEIFEKLVTEHFGQIWVKDHVPFTEAGDIEVNGTAYQIKYEKATFTNEKTLQNLGA